jgi:predicted O-methyltransferase YrrM
METKSWTPAELLQISGGYWSACALHAGVKLDVFTPLDERTLTARELADILGVNERGLFMLMNALAALNLLGKKGDTYITTPFAATYLSKSSPDYLGHIILHHSHLMESWSRLDEAVRSGRPDQARLSQGEDEEVRENFEMGMFNLAMQIAPRIVSQIDLSGRRSLLDLGGGPGTYAVRFCLQNPDLNAVVYDLPSTRPFAEQTIALFDLSDRIVFKSGDFMKEQIKGHYDVVWLSHILHGVGPEGCALILEKAVAALNQGGLIMVQEFILDDSMDSPLYPALFSMNMLLGTPDGRAYSQSELFAMMSAAGAENPRRISLDLPNGAGVIAAFASGL